MFDMEVFVEWGWDQALFATQVCQLAFARRKTEIGEGKHVAPSEVYIKAMVMEVGLLRVPAFRDILLIKLMASELDRIEHLLQEANKYTQQEADDDND